MDCICIEIFNCVIRYVLVNAFIKSKWCTCDRPLLYLLGFSEVTYVTYNHDDTLPGSWLRVCIRHRICFIIQTVAMKLCTRKVIYMYNVQLNGIERNWMKLYNLLKSHIANISWTMWMNKKSERKTWLKTFSST